MQYSTQCALAHLGKCSVSSGYSMHTENCVRCTCYILLFLRNKKDLQISYNDCKTLCLSVSLLTTAVKRHVLLPWDHAASRSLSTGFFWMLTRSRWGGSVTDTSTLEDIHKHCIALKRIVHPKIMWKNCASSSYSMLDQRLCVQGAATQPGGKRQTQHSRLSRRGVGGGMDRGADRERGEQRQSPWPHTSCPTHKPANQQAAQP